MGRQIRITGWGPKIGNVMCRVAQMGDSEMYRRRIGVRPNNRTGVRSSELVLHEVVTQLLIVCSTCRVYDVIQH